MNPTLRAIGLIGLMLVLTLPITARSSVTPFNLHIGQQNMTIYAEGVLLSDLLNEIGRQGDIRINLISSSDETVSADLKEIPIEMGLKRLLRNYSHAFIYEKIEKKPEPIIKALFVYARTGNDSSAVIWSLEKEGDASAPKSISENSDVFHPQAPAAGRKSLPYRDTIHPEPGRFSTGESEYRATKLRSPENTSEAVSEQIITEAGVEPTAALSDVADPLQSMEGIDPMARFDVSADETGPSANPLLADPHETYLKGPDDVD